MPYYCEECWYFPANNIGLAVLDPRNMSDKYQHCDSARTVAAPGGRLNKKDGLTRMAIPC